jgi:hypothetical protein
MPKDTLGRERLRALAGRTGAERQPHQPCWPIHTAVFAATLEKNFRIPAVTRLECVGAFPSPNGRRRW